MTDLENIKIIDEEKQQPLLASAPELQSDAGKRTISSSDKLTRVTLVLLLILNFVQWRYSMIAHDASKADECLQKENAALKLQDQVRSLCLDRTSLLKSVEAASKLASIPSNSGGEALQALEDFLSTTTIESEAISGAFQKVEKVLAEQSALLYERATTLQAVNYHHPQQDLASVCDMLTF